MSARAVSAALTADRILDAAVEVFWQSPIHQVSLEEVARRAEVSVQTVIRRFGGKEALLAAAVEREAAAVRDHRDQAPVGDVPAAMRVLVDHYETYGDRVVTLLAEADRSPALAPIVQTGRRVHRRWCAQVFAATLTARRGIDRRRRLAQLIAVCDVYTWKLLRRDSGLSRRQTELALVELVGSLVEGSA